MGKFLKVLVIILLPLSLAVLVLASLLFGKRELLKGRTQKLEKAVIALGATIEEGPAVLDEKPDYPARDISPVTSQPIDTPEISEFWDNYAAELEAQDQPMLDLKKKSDELTQYYKLDPITRKPQRDGRGYKVVKGEGTMQGVLTDLLQKAGEQYSRLTKTRQQLQTVREELVSTIQELNREKRRLRTSLKTIEELEAKIEELNGQVRSLTQKVRELDDEVLTLKDQIAEQKNQIAALNEESQQKDKEIKRLADLVEKLRGETRTTPGGPMGVLEQPIEPGIKGSVAAVSEEWNFVAIQLSDEFMREILGPDMSRDLPGNIQLMIRRGGGTEQFVTKVRLLQVRRARKLGIADIMPEWQQAPVQEGDVVFY